MKEKELPPVTGRELEALAVLWKLPKNGALTLPQIHEQICDNRVKRNESPAAFTNVSSVLRETEQRGFITVVGIQHGKVVKKPMWSGRISLVEDEHSVEKAYQALCTPSEAITPLLRTLVDCYPPNNRHQALLDVATALNLDQEVIGEIDRVLPKM